MQSAHIKLIPYDWTIHLYFNSRLSDYEEILDRLKEVGCSGGNYLSALRSLSNGKLNEGLTYSNYERRESVLVVGEASSLDELMNSSAHEVDHLAKHIAQACDIDVFSEEASYLVGDITQKIYNVLKMEMRTHRCS